MDRNKPFFPLFVDLSEKHIVVIGAGNIASRRIKALLDFAGKITVIAPEIAEEILSVSENGNLCCFQRCFEEGDLHGADLVLAATDDAALNVTIGKLCREKKIPVNVSHDKSLCDFYFPGIVHKDDVVIGVTASGKDHSQARAITEKIRNVLDEKGV